MDPAAWRSGDHTDQVSVHHVHHQRLTRVSLRYQCELCFSLNQLIPDLFCNTDGHLRTWDPMFVGGGVGGVGGEERNNLVNQCLYLICPALQRKTKQLTTNVSGRWGQRSEVSVYYD